MSKLTSRYVCQQCGYESVGWLGKCTSCGAWNSMVETVVETYSKTSKRSSTKIVGSSLTTQKLSDIKASDIKRINTKIDELDRVLGGGLVKGQAILIAGEPGIGKSTLLLQVANSLNEVIYVCGEESSSQVAVRAQRLKIKNNKIELLENTDVDDVMATLKNNKEISAVIIDSIQTMTTSDLNGMAGSVGQVRESAFRLINYAKQSNIPVFIVGHVTKEGTVAGPAVLAHMVDTVLWFEGDKTATLRILRAVKNRFGPTDEVGIFEMKDSGLVSINNLDTLFIDKNIKNTSGTVVTSVMQGTRPLLVEIQALVIPTKLAIPRRVVQGIDSKRLELILAVLTKRCGLKLFESDVFVNVVGGIKSADTSSDLAIALAVASSYFDKSINSKVVAVGEVGLLGEVRGVLAQEKRIKEAKRLGYTNTITNQGFETLQQVIKKYLR